MNIRKFTVWVLVLMVALCGLAGSFAEDAEAQFNEVIGAEIAGDVTAADDILQDVPYVEDDNKDHMLDLFGAQTAEGLKPVIVEVHGGGYIGGKKEINTDHAKFYAENGYVVVAPNYTHLPMGTFKTAIQDLFTVFAWMEAHAEEYHFDLTHVGISGDSAGGYYVLLVAAIMNQPELQEYFEVTPPAFDFAAYVTTCPGTDVVAIKDGLGQSGPAGYMAGKIGEEILNDEDLMSHCDLYSIINPETYPYIYMITTPGDETTGAETQKFDQFLTEKGVDHILISYEDEGSGLIHVFNITKMEYPESQKANADIVAYIDSILKASEKKIIVCVGDSLTYGVMPRTPGKRNVTYPDTLAHLLGDEYDVLNLGKPGHTLTAAGVCYLARPEYQQSIDAAADMYIIMLGTNDSNLEDKWDAEAYENDLNTVVDTYKAANPDTIIVLIAPPIVLPDSLTNEISMDISLLEGPIRDIIKRVSQEKNTCYLDMYQKTTEEPEWIGEDGIHFTQEGYEAFGTFVYDYIKDLI